MLTIKPYYRKWKNLKNKNKRYKRRINKLEENQKKAVELIKKTNLQFLIRKRLCELLGDEEDC